MLKGNVRLRWILTTLEIRTTVTNSPKPQNINNPIFDGLIYVAEREGFEPSWDCSPAAFQAVALGLYATSPGG